MSYVQSFAPLVPAGARLLILGSMPGAASLAAGQYYAHPRNAFWPILAALCHFPADAPYAARVAALQAAGVAVWDVLQSCVRPGSLDTAIERGSEVPNDLVGLLVRHPGIGRICFNGGTAEAAFRRHVPAAAVAGRQLLRLPSTSPANASWSFERKLAAWKAAFEE
ncbi:MAG: DNA-deoxyinosine glycosylase [Rhodocyclaceae bacterium]|nr:DNA-deoxyinosine glycosylase [Rhodocyclaceae bacterium]